MTTDPRDCTEPSPAPHAEAPRERSKGSVQSLEVEPSVKLGFNKRWVFMFLLFIYLLASAMTLFEIDAFQTLVAQLGALSEDQGTAAGNARQREILQAVRSVNVERRGSDGDVDDQKALYERVAAKLDPLRVAVNALDDIGARATFEVRDDETYQRAQQQTFRELADRIGLAVGDLRKQVADLRVCDEAESTTDGAESDPEQTEEQGALEQCGRIQGIKNSLIALDIGIAGLSGLLPAGEGVRREDLEQRIARAKESAQELKAAAEEVETALADPGSPAVLSSLVEALSGRLDELQDVTEGGVLDMIVRSYPDKGGYQREADPRAREELKPINESLALGSNHPDVRELRRTLEYYGISKGTPERYRPDGDPEDRDLTRLDADLVARVRSFQEDEGIDVDGRVGPTTRGRLEAFRRTCNEDLNACLGVGDPRQPRPESKGITADIAQMRSALHALRDYVRVQNVDLAKISELTRELASIEMASRRLADLDIRVDKAPGTDAEAAEVLEDNRRKYQKATVDLATAINGMRSTLGASSGVIVIADAIGEQDPLAHKKATTILREFDALGRYQRILTPLSFLALPTPQCTGGYTSWGQALCGAAHGSVRLWNTIANIGFRARDMATMTRQGLDMMVVFVMGAIGSLIYLTRYLLSQILLGKEGGSPVWRPMHWYVFRPLFGIVVAFSIYLLYKTGQVALGGSNANVLASDVNLPILSVFSLFAGLLSWQALEMVEKKGRKWLCAQHRENLWASGLSRSLRVAGKTRDECASQVGVSPMQMDRWIAGQDRVTPEMQDRIATWINRPRTELFSDVNPQDMDEGTLCWAKGLKGALKTNKAGIDAPRLAQLIGRDTETVQAWADLRRQVDQPSQFLISEKLGVARDELFSIEPPDAEYWAVGLRTAIEKGSSGPGSADELAREIGSTQQNVRRYMELKLPVPKTVRELIIGKLGLDHSVLFSPNLPLDSAFKWAVKLRESLRESAFAGSAELAERIDTEPTWVRSWMELEVCGEEDPPYCGQVAPATQLALSEALDCASETLFRSERGAGDFRWVTMPRFAELVDARGGIDALARRLDLDIARIRNWMAGSEAVAPETQLALLADLGLAVEERTGLFSGRPQLEPERPGGTWWATGLRAAVRVHPVYRSLRALANELQIPVRDLFEQAELLTPVPVDLRDHITRVLGHTPDKAPLFTTQAPDFSRFWWLPGLRVTLQDAGMSASALATALDVDLDRVHDWMEMDERQVATLWAQDKVKRGQVCPATCDAIDAILDVQLERLEYRPDTGALWTVKPAFGMAVEAFDGGAGGFAEQVDSQRERVERWVAQEERVERATQDRVLDELGLDQRADRDQLFAPEKREEKSVG